MSSISFFTSHHDPHSPKIVHGCSKYIHYIHLNLKHGQKNWQIGGVFNFTRLLLFNSYCTLVGFTRGWMFSYLSFMLRIFPFFLEFCFVKYRKWFAICEPLIRTLIPCSVQVKITILLTPTEQYTLVLPPKEFHW